MPPTTDYFRLGAARLYQPDDVLAARLSHGVDELGRYLMTLTWVGTEYFGRLGRDFGSLGVLIGVGIKRNRQTKLWCDVVDGEISHDVWGTFVVLLEGAGEEIRPEVTAPVACALECVVGAGPCIEFPIFPRAWMEATSAAGRALDVPDDLFEIVFPD